MSSRTDFGSKSKIADFEAAEFLSGNVTATDVEKLKKKELILVAKELLMAGKQKAEIKAFVL